MRNGEPIVGSIQTHPQTYPRTRWTQAQAPATSAGQKSSPPDPSVQFGSYMGVKPSPGDIQDDVPPHSWFADKRLQYFIDQWESEPFELREAFGAETALRMSLPGILAFITLNPSIQDRLRQARTQLDAPEPSETPIRIGDGDLTLLKQSNTHYILRYTSSIRHFSYPGSVSSRAYRLNRVEIPLVPEGDRLILPSEAPTNAPPRYRLRFLPHTLTPDPKTNTFVDTYLSAWFLENRIARVGDVVDVGLTDPVDTLRETRRLLREFKWQVDHLAKTSVERAPA